MGLKRSGRQLTGKLNPLFIFSRNIKLSLIIISAVIGLVSLGCFAEDPPPSEEKPLPVLKKAVLCEKVVKSMIPVNEGVVFSADIGKVTCFTDFDPVNKETYIYHKFYFRDKLSNTFRRLVKPPRWATSSSIYLRESDKGPWRLDVTDAEGNILSRIRFSITD